jgi:transcriptional regulator
MYLPSHFAWTDPADHLAFCRAHPFATVFAAGPGDPEAQHLPLLCDLDQGRLVLHGHAALGDPLWRAPRALAVFSGPHAYVSAAWYGEADTVPTWNYLALHAAGPLRVIDDPGAVRALLARLAAADPEHAAWQDRLGADAYARLAAAVRWFRLDADRVEAKAKLSQNHAPARRERVIARLLAHPDPAARATGAAMARVLAGGPPWGTGAADAPA